MFYLFPLFSAKHSVRQTVVLMKTENKGFVYAWARAVTITKTTTGIIRITDSY